VYCQSIKILFWQFAPESNLRSFSSSEIEASVRSVVIPLDEFFERFESFPMLFVSSKPSLNFPVRLGMFISAEDLFNSLLSKEFFVRMYCFSFFVSFVRIKLASVISNTFSYNTDVAIFFYDSFQE